MIIKTVWYFFCIKKVIFLPSHLIEVLRECISITVYWKVQEFFDILEEKS